MADLPRPFIAFNFSVEITVDGSSNPLCRAAFSECDGLEMSMDVKSIREGGNNARHIRLPGPTTFGQLTLKRGMTEGGELWSWFARVQQQPSTRATGTIVLLDEASQDERARFVVSRCLPVKVKAPPLNAKDGMVAVEELQIAYESLELQGAGGA